MSTNINTKILKSRWDNKQQRPGGLTIVARIFNRMLIYSAAKITQKLNRIMANETKSSRILHLYYVMRSIVSVCCIDVYIVSTELVY